MKKLSAAVDRFAMQHPRFGIPNLMLYIVGGNAIVYLLSVFAGAEAVSFLAFHWAAIKSGELWRLVTFIFMPGYFSSRDILWLLLFLYFYYMIGTSLEQAWGTAKFNLYYLSGVVLTALTGVLVGLVGGDAWMSGADYVNLSMFFAFAALYPETRFLIMFIIPVKVKWLAIIDGVFFAIGVLSSLLRLDVLGALVPVIALLNFFVFFWGALSDELAYRQTIQFKSAVRQQKKKEAERGYRHKCAVCGRTDTSNPELEFRYCSRCAGYHCFCQDHIFNHEHFTE